MHRRNLKFNEWLRRKRKLDDVVEGERHDDEETVTLVTIRRLRNESSE